MNPKRLFLIDGMSHIYRAYYAIRNLSNSKGIPTNAVFGFTSMLRKLIQDEKPDYIGVAFDVAGPTVRHERFEAYKATRKPMPEDLVQQLPYIRRVCEAFGVPIIELPGYEADDVIGTLSAKAAAQGLESILVTSDKDMLQLVSDHIRVLDTAKDNLILDEQKVQEKMGVRPDQVPDLLGLWGDSSDNIPGAPGIGEKGAKELIQMFGTIQNAVTNWEKVKKKTYQTSLRDNADLIRMSRELATIRRDLPIKLDLSALSFREPDRKAAFDIFSEMEFKSLMREFLDEKPHQRLEGEWLAGTKAGEFLQHLTGQKAVYFCFNFEEGAFGRRKAAVACVQGESGNAAAIDLRDAELARAWGELMRCRSVRKICWDAKLSLQAQEPLGILMDANIDDVMLMAFLTAPHIGDYSLRRWSLSELYLALPKEISRRQGILSSEPHEATVESLFRQLESIQRLYEILGARLDEMGLRDLYASMEIPLILVLADMEGMGVKIDRATLQKMSAEMEKRLGELTTKIYEAAGTTFNINSPKQLGEVLFEKLNLPSAKKTRKTGGYSTDQAVLEELAESYDIPRLILEYRQVAKLKSTYVDALPELIQPDTGRVHTSFNQTGAATGRLSSSDPNLQNIPIRSDLGRLIRAAFIPDSGNLLISADYSQVELRVLAHLSQDQVLMDAFQKDQDIHDRTAKEVFSPEELTNRAECRRRAKVINFGIVYGLSAFGLAQKLGISREEAQTFIDSYFLRYQGVRSWLNTTLEEARKNGSVRTLFGRIRPVPDILSKDFNARHFAERIAVNSPIQGTAADIIKLAMIRLHNTLQKRDLSAKILIQVHDELVVEVPRAELEETRALVRREMEHAAELIVPLKVDINVADNWMDMK